MKPKFRNLKAKAKAKMSPWVWNSALLLMDFRIWFFYFFDCMTPWVFKEPATRGPFIWIIKFPPGLRTMVPISGMTEDLLSLHSLSKLVLLWDFALPGLDGPRNGATEMLKVKHKKELCRPGQGCPPRPGRVRQRGGTHASLLVFKWFLAQGLTSHCFLNMLHWSIWCRCDYF